MMLNKGNINKKLDELYSNFLNKIFAKNNDITQYTTPLLVRCSKKYAESELKMLIVGIENNKWNTENYLISQKDNHYEYAIDKLSDSYEKYMERLKTESPRLTIEKTIHKIIMASKEFSCLYTNIFRFGIKDHFASKEFGTFLDVNYSIIDRELDYLNPDVIIFATADSRNENDYAYIRNVLGSKSLFIQSPEDEQIKIVTNHNENMFVLRIPINPKNSTSFYQTLTQVIKGNYAYKY